MRATGSGSFRLVIFVSFVVLWPMAPLAELSLRGLAAKLLGSKASQELQSQEIDHWHSPELSLRRV
jgi:hypothetical protein